MEHRDDELVRRFQAGDADAFEGIVCRWDPEVLRLAFRLTGSLEDARDVRQEAWLRTYDALGGFNGHATVSTWLYRIVLNLSRDGHRRRARRDRALDGVAERGRAEDRGAPAPDATAAGREAAERVAAAVAALSPDEREVVVLRHYHDLSFPAIAEVLGAPVTTVKSRMARGLRSLRILLKNLEP